MIKKLALSLLILSAPLRAADIDLATNLNVGATAVEAQSRILPDIDGINIFITCPTWDAEIGRGFLTIALYQDINGTWHHLFSTEIPYGTYARDGTSIGFGIEGPISGRTVKLVASSSRPITISATGKTRERNVVAGGTDVK